MIEIRRVTLLFAVGAFVAGLVAHVLYHRWAGTGAPGRAYPVSYSPLPALAHKQHETPVVHARETEKLKGLAGTRAKVRGRVFRVGHAAKSDTYFLDFGPSRASFTGVIFASAVGLFEKRGIRPMSYEGREVELSGEIKDHPKYGLEMILEDPEQIRLRD